MANSREEPEGPVARSRGRRACAVTGCYADRESRSVGWHSCLDAGSFLGAIGVGHEWKFPAACDTRDGMPPPFIFTMRQVRKITAQGKEILKGISLAFYRGAKIGV